MKKILTGLFTLLLAQNLYGADIALTRVTTATTISSSTENSNQTAIEGAVNSLDGDNISTSANLTFNNATINGATDLNSSVNIDGGLTDIGTGSYSVANGDNDLGVAGDLEVDNILKVDGATTLGDAAVDTVTVTGTSTFTEVVTIDQNDNVGSMIIDSEAADGAKVILVDDPKTTSSIVLQIVNADALTSGAIVDFHSNSADTTTRNLVTIRNDNALADAAVCLSLTQDGDTTVILETSSGAKLTGGGAWIDASSGDLKENFTEAACLSFIKELDIKKWNYKKEGRKSKVDIAKLKSEEKVRIDSNEKLTNSEKQELKTRLESGFDAKEEREKTKIVPMHIGPTSEEFYDKFGLGDRQGISGRDLAAVALRGIQEQQVIIEDLQTRVATLESQIALNKPIGLPIAMGLGILGTIAYMKRKDD